MLTIVVVSAFVIQRKELLKYALLSSAQGMPYLACILFQPEKIDSNITSMEHHRLLYPMAATAMPASVMPPDNHTIRIDKESVQHMHALIQSAVKDIAGTDADGIQIDDPLMTSGINSTRAVALTTQLEQTLGVSLPATLVFDYPSIKEISEHIMESFPGSMTSPVMAAPAVADAAHPRTTSHAAASKLVTAAVHELLGGLGDTTHIASNTPLMNAGLNSTAAVALTSTLESSLGVALPPTLVFDYPSIDSIVDYLVDGNLVPSAASAVPAVPPVAAAAAAAANDCCATQVPCHHFRPSTLVQPAKSAPALFKEKHDAIVIAATAHRLPGDPLNHHMEGKQKRSSCSMLQHAGIYTHKLPNAAVHVYLLHFTYLERLPQLLFALKTCRGC